MERTERHHPPSQEGRIGAVQTGFKSIFQNLPHTHCRKNKPEFLLKVQVISLNTVLDYWKSQPHRDVFPLKQSILPYHS